MKEGVTYNRADNEIFVRTDGDSIYVICNTEDQTDFIVSKMTTQYCKLVGYEEWDEKDDMKWILKFLVHEEGYSMNEDLN